MAHEPVKDVARAPTQPQEVPEGAIGATIADEQPGKFKNFVTDPKNLATMLVLAAALAQPRRGGRNDLAHALRAGTGALAFRGGLDREISQQEQEAEEAKSVIAGRTASQEVQAQRNTILNKQQDIDVRGQLIDVSEGEKERTSEEKIANIRAEAVQGRLNDELLKMGYDAYYKAVLNQTEFGGPEIDLGDYIVLPPGYSLTREGEGEVQGAVIPEDGGGPGATPTRKQRVKFGPKILSGVPVPGLLKLRGDLPEATVKSTVIRISRKRYPELYEGLGDEEVLAKLNDFQETMRAKLVAGMSQNEAKTVVNDKPLYAQLTIEQRRELARLARGTGPPIPDLGPAF